MLGRVVKYSGICVVVVVVAWTVQNRFRFSSAAGLNLEVSGAGVLVEEYGHPISGTLDVERGLMAWRQGDDAAAFDHFGACLKNDTNNTRQMSACQAAMGEFLLTTGLAVVRNLSRANWLLQQAANAGDADAQYTLALWYASTPRSVDDLRRREALSILHLYAASTAGHHGALMAMGYRHTHGYGVPQACATAALNYIDVAKTVAKIYSEGLPQAVELIRLNLNHKDRRVITASQMNLYIQIATSGDTSVAAAIGKRYLLGIEGFKQDYTKAKYYLKMASDGNHASALALLGYMHCLGIGVPQDLDTAYFYFVSAASKNDPLGHNGLGYVYFTGTSAQPKNLRLAFRHFNESAFGGSSDGMFNLASMYLTGTGVDQSFNKAVIFYTQALDRGHTPAAYSLAVMHLNGIGTIRDCSIAVNLLKKVCERGDWVSAKLVDAYELTEKAPDKAALLYLKLAEAGHEVAQMNAAHMFDGGHTTLLREFEDTHGLESEASDDARHHSRKIAQRLYELSAEQGSASSELRLGDYAFSGWGVAASFKHDSEPEFVQVGVPSDSDSDQVGKNVTSLSLRSLYTSSELMLETQTVDYETALARYRKAAEMTVSGEWMQAFVARGSFNLAFMHQFGLGVPQDLHTARLHYQRCREVDPDPNGMQAPVTLALVALSAHMTYLRFPPWSVLFDRLLADMRVHRAVASSGSIFVLVLLRWHLSRRIPA